MILRKSASSRLSNAERVLKIFKLGAKLWFIVYDEVRAVKISKLIVVPLKSVCISYTKSYFYCKCDTANILDLRTPLTNIVYGMAPVTCMCVWSFIHDMTQKYLMSFLAQR